MCGLNGLVRLEGGPPLDRPEWVAELSATCAVLARRGPDGEGRFLSDGADVALAHRRLSILDLSPAGAQPMASADGRFVGVMNGEIYNFRALAEDLRSAGVALRTRSDTEVLLEMFALQGPAMLARLRGMFALAIWDERERRLFLARDPFGIKPLYVAEHGRVVRFASQVKALLAGGSLPVEIDPVSLAGFLVWGSVPEPRAFWKGISAVPAGSYQWVERDGLRPPVRYYEPGGPPSYADSSSESISDALADSVTAHLVSDVPVGVFLSAGLDSSLLAALASRASSQSPTTVTAAFDLLAGTPLDERRQAAATARGLGTRHVEVRIGREDFRRAWPEILAAMDQPSIDGANSFLVARAAREAGLKVVLSGLGGDELFGGYSTFTSVPRTRLFLERSRRLGLDAVIGRLLPYLSRSPKARYLHTYAPYSRTLAGSYLLRRALFLPEELPPILAPLLGEAGAREALAHYDPRVELDALVSEARKAFPDSSDSDWATVHWLETRAYMSHTLLRDADWASMAHGLEVRLPFVDAWLHRAVAAAHFEPARTRGKAALFREAAPELPDTLWKRPKTGFYIPVSEWLEGSADAGTAASEKPTVVQAADRGSASRRLATAVLANFGVELPT